MIEEALRFPFKQQDWFRKGVGGYLLAVASLLVIPAPLLLGYMVRVMKEDQMPGFKNLVQMFRQALLPVH